MNQPELPKRLPLVIMPENRDSTTARDAKLVNCYVEKDTGDQYHIYKRPGMLVQSSLGVATGLGMFNWQGVIYSIFGTTLYRNGVSVGTIDGTAPYQFSACLGSQPKLFFNNGAAAYVFYRTPGLLGVLTLTAVLPPVVISTTGTITVNSPSITAIASTAAMTVNSSVAGTGIPLGAYITVINSATAITISSNALSSAAGVNLTVTTFGLPTGVFAGSAYLDSTTYTIDATARIYGSNLNDPQTWNPLNNLIAQIEPDGGVSIAKTLVYVIAFKQWSTEVFYDAANSVGSPLGTVQGSKVNYGCAAAASIQDIDGSLIWLATNRSSSLFVVMFENLQVSVISTKPIQRLLDGVDLTTVYSWQHKENSHSFYILTIKNSNLTLVYDLGEKTWFQWTDSNGNYVPIVSSTLAATSSGPRLVQHESNGKIYTVSNTYYTDDGSTITVDIYTPGFDGGVNKRKMLPRLEIICDQTSGSTLSVRSSDDDYQTWSNFRQMDLGKKRAYLNNNGSFYRRAYHLRHTANTPMRIQAMELSMELGTL